MISDLLLTIERFHDMRFDAKPTKNKTAKVRRI